MDAEVLGNFQSFAGTFNVFEYRARQTAWDGALQCLSNRLNALKVALTRNREACFNDVHAELFERERDLQFLSRSVVSKMMTRLSAILEIPSFFLLRMVVV